MEYEDKAAKLMEVLESRKSFPDYIFSRRFEQHFFFDLDICSSDIVICAAKEIILNCLGTEVRVAVFSFTERTLLGWLESDDDWSFKIGAMSESLRRSGDYNGLILIDDLKKCIVYQARPVDLGILAFDGSNNWRAISTVARDCFVDAHDIESWLTGESVYGAALVNDLGREYLAALAKNYA